MARKWDIRKKISDDPSKFLYEIIVVILVIAAIIYSIVTGTTPENTGF